MRTTFHHLRRALRPQQRENYPLSSLSPFPVVGRRSWPTQPHVWLAFQLGISPLPTVCIPPELGELWKTSIHPCPWLLVQSNHFPRLRHSAFLLHWGVLVSPIPRKRKSWTRRMNVEVSPPPKTPQPGKRKEIPTSRLLQKEINQLSPWGLGHD